MKVRGQRIPEKVCIKKVRGYEGGKVRPKEHLQ